MQFADYANRYNTINFARNDYGVLEVTIHTRGGEASWGVTEQSLHAELGEAFGDIARDPANRIMILTGTGRSFLSGLDLQEQAPEATSEAKWGRIYREGVSLLENLLAIPVPVISVVNGPALIHAEIPLLADIVLAAPHAEFADEFHVARGVVPGDGVHSVWPMLLGPNRGRYFLLTAQHITAEEALRLGLVAEVLEPEALMPRARELANGLARNTTMMLRHTRALFTRNLRQRIREELELGLALESLGAQARDAGLR